jgi:hypothetical protein
METPQEKSTLIETPIASHSATPLPIHPSPQMSSRYYSLTSTEVPNPDLLHAINNLSATLKSSIGTVLPVIIQLSADFNKHASMFQTLNTNAPSSNVEMTHQLADAFMVASQNIQTLDDSLRSTIPILTRANTNFESAVRALTDIGNTLLEISKNFPLDEFALQLSERIANNFNQGISGYFSSLTREKPPSSEREKQSQAQLKNLAYLVKSVSGQVNNAMKDTSNFLEYAKAGNEGKSAKKP